MKRRTFFGAVAVALALPFVGRGEKPRKKIELLRVKNCESYHLWPGLGVVGAPLWVDGDHYWGIVGTTPPGGKILGTVFGRPIKPGEYGGIRLHG